MVEKVLNVDEVQRSLDDLSLRDLITLRDTVSEAIRQRRINDLEAQKASREFSVCEVHPDYSADLQRNIQIIELARTGRSIGELAKKFKLSKQRISQIVNRVGTMAHRAITDRDVPDEVHKTLIRGRTLNTLTRMGIDTWAKAREIPLSTFMGMENVDRVTVAEIVHQLKRRYPDYRPFLYGSVGEGLR